MPCMALIIHPPSGLYEECQVWLVIIYPWGHTTILLPFEVFTCKLKMQFLPVEI